RGGESDVESGCRPFLRFLHVGGNQASRCLERDRRGCATAFHLEIADNTRRTDTADHACSRAIETIRLDKDDVARAADAWADRLHEIQADARHRRSIECTPVLH